MTHRPAKAAARSCAALPLAFVPGRSELSVCRISRHLRTNAELLGYFLPVRVEIDGETDQPGRVRLQGISAPKPA